MNQIKTITLSTGTWLLMKVPADGREFAINKIDGRQYLTADKGEPMGAEFYVGTEPVPAGHTYTLIGKASELTEDQWKQIVEQWDSGGFNDYERHLARVKTSAESGHSLLKSQGMDIETTVILKQND